MPTVVQKFGGSSVADVERLKKVARKVAARRAEGFEVVVVVSAMGDSTDELLGLARKVHPDPPRRELDMLLTCGERISMALLSMALQEIGVPAVSFTGSQSGIITTTEHSRARVLEVRPQRIHEALGQGKVVIVAGYQGVSVAKEVTTLGRGGSDTTAVALAAALEADCEIYSDVDGVFSADPRVVPDARKLELLSYDEMQALAAAGAKVLNAQAVELARAKGILVHARSTHTEGTGSVIGPPPSAVSGRVRAVASESEVLLLTGRVPLTELGRLSACLSERGLSPRAASLQCVADHPEPSAPRGVGQTVHPERSPKGGVEGAASLCWIFPLQDAHGLDSASAVLAPALRERLAFEESWGTVSCVGAGIRCDALMARAAEIASEHGVAIRAIHGSALEVSLVVPRERTAALTRALHAALVGA